MVAGIGRTQQLAGTLLGMALVAPSAWSGPETSIREFGSAQIKKGVRSIGMGGDGATAGNYALVYREAATAIVDYGITRYTDTGDAFDFAAVGMTSPKFWDDTAVYVAAIAQRAHNVAVWSVTSASTSKPVSQGEGRNDGVFVKVAKPINHDVSVGILLSHEESSMTLRPRDGTAQIRYNTMWRPSGGAGVTWQPEPWLLTGLRVVAGDDLENRRQGTQEKNGILRSREYRGGVSVSPWDGGLLDAGFVILDRQGQLDGSSTHSLNPTFGGEQAVIAKTLWLRAGLDETSVTAGVSWRWEPIKVDVAYVRNLGHARTGDIFGKESNSVMATLNYDYL